ncbi:MAG: hypothetical protein LBD52_01960 [Prevotellaceae bacterium]|jgi:hypothetical protein|nr:hypothetical protein [Prevotellaceae bacterium]
MAYTIEQYQTLIAAIAKGIKSVAYGDKTVTYNSFSEMSALKRAMEAELYPEKAIRRRKLAVIDRGFFPQTNRRWQ